MKLAEALIRKVTRRPPDFVIGGTQAVPGSASETIDRPYLRRWWVIPRNPFFNIYLHQFLRSDDDRALHDHPWANASVLLRGCYVEHTIAAGGVSHRATLIAGDIRVRWTGRIAHRVELIDGPCWTLFITGPRYRDWGFHCPEQGWVPWQRFTAAHDKGAVGAGCDS